MALITGAASGIGLRCAQRLAERGARVVGVVSRESRVRAFKEHVGDGHPCVVADLSQVADVRRAAAEAGDVDALVNAAGVGAMASFLDVETDAFEQCVAVNCRAPLVLSQCVARNMIARALSTRSRPEEALSSSVLSSSASSSACNSGVGAWANSS